MGCGEIPGIAERGQTEGTFLDSSEFIPLITSFPSRFLISHLSRSIKKPFYGVEGLFPWAQQGIPISIGTTP